jgi:hypothetical protein
MNGLNPGVTGATGAAGVTGAAGATGATGDNGLAGNNGNTGDAGATAAAGPDGGAGNDGNDGQTGDAGDNGQTAANGIDGTAGANGIDGLAGGFGGSGVTGAAGASNGAGGLGGVAVTGEKNTTVINSGLISGGLSYDASIRANAIEFTKGGNTLELQAGTTINGMVRVDRTNNDIDSAGIDTFALGGDVDASFFVERFGSTAQMNAQGSLVADEPFSDLDEYFQYEVATAADPLRGFTNFEKVGTSTWDLYGDTSDLVTAWTLKQGTLSVEAEVNLGDDDGDLTFDGGTFQVRGSGYQVMDPDRDLIVTSNGGAIDIEEAGHTFTINQDIDGGGNWGEMAKIGLGTLVLNGAGTYGDLFVDEGTLVLGENSTIDENASTYDDVFVAEGAVLEGHGYIGDDLWNNGTVKVGTDGDIGTLRVADEYGAFGDGGTVVFSLDGMGGPGVLADQLIVEGANTAFLDGTSIVADKEFYSELDCGDNVRLIVANNYVGEVESFTHNFDKMMLLVKQNTHLYGVNVLNNQGFEYLPGLNGNQQNVAAALSDYVLDGSNLLDNTDPLHLAVIDMIDQCGDAPGVLNLLSPESYAGLVDYGIQVTRNYTRTALMAPGAMPVTPSEPITEKGAKGGKVVIEPELTTRNTTVFAAFSHIDAGTDSSDSSADYNIRSNGGLVGARHSINALSFGGFVGYDEGKISSRFLDADADGYVLGGFVSYLANARHNVLITAGVTYGSYDYDGDRESFTGKYDFSTDSDVLDYYIQVQGDAYKNDRFRVTPSLGLHYIDADVDGFDEEGVFPGTGLNIDGMQDDALLAELEVKFEYAVTSKFLVNGSVGYTHNFSGSERDVDAAFQLGGGGFSVTAPGLGDDIFSVGIGAVWYINEAFSAGFGYRAEFGSDQDVTNAAGIAVSYSF